MQTAPYRFQLLAPSEATTAQLRDSMVTAPDSYEHYLSSMQRLRARTYLDDGAIKADELDEYGRFRMHQDEQCWHFLLIDSDDQVVGCVRYLAHSADAAFEDLWISRSPLACDQAWASQIRSAVDSDLSWARRQNLSFIEIGGWAIAEEHRHTRAALEVMLASFAWARMIGGGIGCCTATFRNSSASILRRIGGTSFEHQGEAIPPYDDPSYGCSMEVLRFHFQAFDSRYQKVVNDIYRRLTESSSVIRRNEALVGESSEVLTTRENLLALHCALQRAEQKVSTLVGA
jgi:hypothetical protein